MVLNYPQTFSRNFISAKGRDQCCIYHCYSWTVSIKPSLVIHNSRFMTKPTKWNVCPAKTQISLGIHPVWSESSLSAGRKLGSLATHWAHSEDADQTLGAQAILLVLSWGGSIILCDLLASKGSLSLLSRTTRGNRLVESLEKFSPPPPATGVGLGSPLLACSMNGDLTCT